MLNRGFNETTVQLNDINHKRRLKKLFTIYNLNSIL